MRTLCRAVILLSTFALSVGTVSAGDPFLYTGDSFSGTLYKIDRSTGATLTSIPVTMGGLPTEAIKGLTADPSSGELYAVVVQVQPTDPPEGGGFPSDWFRLATIAPDTGIATEIGGLGDRFAGLAFAPIPVDGDGGIDSLIGVTGDGASTPSSLFIIDTTNASTSFLMTLGNGTAGETIAYNPGDGFLYHLSGENFGQNDGGAEQFFESIDLTTQTVTPINMSGEPFFNGNGLVFDAATGGFLVSASNNVPPSGDGILIYQLFSLSAAGVGANLGETDTFFGGMGFSFLVPVELMSFSVE